MGRSRYKKVQVGGRTVSEHRHVVAQSGTPLSDEDVVHHKNEDRYDNRLDNLEVLSHAEHSQRHNQKHPVTKVCAVCEDPFTPAPTKRKRQVTCSRDCFRALAAANARRQMGKLTIEQVRTIRQRVQAGGVTFAALGREYGVDRTMISAIVHRKAWRMA